MGLLVILHLSLSVAILAVAVPTPAVTQSVSSPVPPCHDWGESREGAVKVLEGEAAWLDCPLFSHPTIYNYSSAVAAGLNLVWYHMAAGQDLEQPLDFHQPDHRLSKERDRLWLQPVLSQDTGQYFCMLRNKTSCAKIAVRLEVKPRSQNPECEVTSAVSPQQAVIPIQEGKTLSCPDVPSTKHSVLWFHGCMMYPFGDRDREVHGNNLVVHIMYEMYEGPYYCVVSYENKGKIMNFTRMINVTAVSPSALAKEPIVLNPDMKQVNRVKLGSDVDLKCRVMFTYLEGGSREMWWTIDGKTVDHLTPRITSTSRMESYDFGNVIMEDVLRIRDFNSEDLTREYNCSARNQRGFSTGRAVLEEEVYLPYVELGCGLGVTLFVMVGLFVVYHVFWLELLLLYRSWFGTDERFTDDKEYDIYISYARNSEEEHFVLMTLRRVLENELGYSVCIFDRDSIPGGNMMEAVLRCLQVSRRLLLVLSPDYLTEKSISLLECRLGLYLQNTCQAHIITILYKPVPAYCTNALDMGRTTTITWRGRQSEPPNSRFWKRLRLALPVRSLSLGRRLIDSSSSHLDLASVALQCQRGTAAPHRQSSAVARGRRKRSRCAGGDKCRRSNSIMRNYITTQNNVVLSKSAGFTLALPAPHNTSTTSYTANVIGTTINPQTADSADTTDATHRDSYLLFTHTDKTDCFSKSIDSVNSLEKAKRTPSISQDQPCPLSTTTL